MKRTSQAADAPTTAAPTTPWKRIGRLGPVFVVFQLIAFVPSSSAGSALQSLAESISPRDKIATYTVVVTVGALASITGAIIGGSSSDLTRTRFGSRAPWILIGGIVGAAGLLLTSVAGSSVALIVIGYALFQGAMNAMQGAVAALLPDYLHRDILGRASSLIGGGYLLASLIGALITAALVREPQAWLAVFAGFFLVGAVVVAALVPKPDNRGLVRAQRRLSLRTIQLPKDADFWLVFSGRASFILALFVTANYGLYIGTDFLHLPKDAAGVLLGRAMLIFTLVAAVSTIVAGPVSDRIHRRRLFVVLAPIVTGAGMIPLLGTGQVWALLLFYGAAGLGFGAYIAVDQAVMVEVLPTRSSAARDLATLGAANSLPLVIAPLLSGLLVAVGGYVAIFIATLVLCVISGFLVTRVRRIR